MHSDWPKVFLFFFSRSTRTGRSFDGDMENRTKVFFFCIPLLIQLCFERNVLICLKTPMNFKRDDKNLQRQFSIWWKSISASSVSIHHSLANGKIVCKCSCVTYRYRLSIGSSQLLMLSIIIYKYYNKSSGVSSTTFGWIDPSLKSTHD